MSDPITTSTRSLLPMRLNDSSVTGSRRPGSILWWIKVLVGGQVPLDSNRTVKEVASEEIDIRSSKSTTGQLSFQGGEFGVA